MKANTEIAIAELTKFATDFVPALADAHIEKTWAGLRPGTPDNLPIVGQIPRWQNAFVATGHFPRRHPAFARDWDGHDGFADLAVRRLCRLRTFAPTVHSPFVARWPSIPESCGRMAKPRSRLMDAPDHRQLVSLLASDLGWLEDHCRRQPTLGREAGQLRLAAALVRNTVGPFLDGQAASPLHVAVVGGAGAGKSTVVNLSGRHRRRRGESAGRLHSPPDCIPTGRRAPSVGRATSAFSARFGGSNTPGPPTSTKMSTRFAAIAGGDPQVRSATSSSGIAPT